MTFTSQTHHDKQPRLLVGIGSVQADDQIGWAVAAHVSIHWGDAVEVRVTSVPLDLLNWITPSTELHIVDACDGNKTPGYLYRWDWSTENEDSANRSSEFLLRGTGTHDFDVVSVLELARRLGRFPQSVTIWGIQGERWAGSETVSPTVAGALPDVCDVIGKELIDARTITGEFTAETGQAALRTT
jgi:hydrogenase maturation protease